MQALDHDRSALAAALPHGSQHTALDLAEGLCADGSTVHHTAAAARTICALITAASGTPVELRSPAADDLIAADERPDAAVSEASIGSDATDTDEAEPGDPTQGPAAAFHGELEPDAVYRRQQADGGDGSLMDSGVETMAGAADDADGTAPPSEQEGTPSRSSSRTRPIWLW